MSCIFFTGNALINILTNQNSKDAVIVLNNKNLVDLKIIYNYLKIYEKSIIDNWTDTLCIAILF